MGLGCICFSVGALGFSCMRRAPVFIRSALSPPVLPLWLCLFYALAFLWDHWVSRECRGQLCSLALPSRRLCSHCGCACLRPCLFVGALGFSCFVVQLALPSHRMCCHCVCACFTPPCKESFRRTEGVMAMPMLLPMLLAMLLMLLLLLLLLLLSLPGCCCCWEHGVVSCPSLANPGICLCISALWMTKIAISSTFLSQNKAGIAKYSPNWPQKGSQRGPREVKMTHVSYQAQFAVKLIALANESLEHWLLLGSHYLLSCCIMMFVVLHRFGSQIIPFKTCWNCFWSASAMLLCCVLFAVGCFLVAFTNILGGV